MSPLSRDYALSNTSILNFNGSMKVAQFEEEYQSEPQFASTSGINKLNYAWGDVFKKSIEADNIELIEHIVCKCSKDIFSFHGVSRLVPLCFAKTPKTLQLLIDLGADVNINTDNNNRCMSPLSHALVYSKTNRNKFELVKCLLKNKADYSKVNERYKNVIETALNEIKYDKECALKCAYVKVVPTLEMQLPKEVVKLIFQAMIDVATPNRAEIIE